MTSHKKMITYNEAFHLASLQFLTFDHFESIQLILSNTSHFWDWCLKFLIFQIDEQAFGFLGIIHFHISRFPFFLVEY